MDLTQLEKIFLDKPPFYLKEARRAVFGNLIDDWKQATTMPSELRGKLNKQCPLDISARISVSKDGTAKTLITLDDGLKIESVLMRYSGRNTVCVSSQAGCPLGCLFCATGKLGFKRNLTTEEIVEQVLFFARFLKKENQRVNNIVFMGMGEPFLNYDNVMAAIKILNDQKQGMAIGARHISVSTIGIIEGIEKFIDEPLQVNLAISLHAPNNKLRSQIVPANKKYPIEKILVCVKKYISKTGRKVMFEYIMIKEMNDSPTQARQLASLIKSLKTKLCMVNLISYNPSLAVRESRQATGIFEPSPQETIKNFKNILQKQGIETTQRFRFGQDIEGACGQLAAK
ncbi:MAG: 23S rRNA (adenine(2503)-C(2))-methyltransferase [Candidatus Portnoybacteria bacterium RBG_19FT_COMBO_36_7]|uniref:Probable dual-specificity RNA methyltransferase RlmN n=1 Tax=Candidatus Portnoybacteria bacterium RBG_19FT_COMBO_36_7 TaxID=1801992 RepID=A0A1G2F752_9BACT|nr:MAG: 23S rRNA (adenine(2503)-C(2))-methyltransferase [Candidatus Portnoybacteria bacterium RBG_19FT_COMBO_36_7]